MISRSLKSHTIGGMEYHIDVLTKGLADRGHTVTIVTTTCPEEMQFKSQENVQIQYLPGMRPGAYSHEWWERSDEKIKEIIKESRVDIFHSQSIACHGALDSIRRSGIGLITTSHGTPITDAVSHSRTKGLKSSPIVMGKTLYYYKHHRNVYRASEKVIAVSDQLARHIIKWGFASEGSVITVPNGVDLDRFKPGLDTADVRDSLALNEEKVLLFLGRVRREKGVDLAIRALPHLIKKVGPVRLVIVGEGDFDEEILPLAKSLGVEDRVLVVGKIDDEKVPLYHNLADVFLMPSTRWEALPLSLLEAIASGSVVVASKVGGIPGVIRDGYNGILVQKGSPDDLVDGCVTALSSTGDEIAKNARETAEEQFDSDKMVEKTIAIYEDVFQILSQ